MTLLRLSIVILAKGFVWNWHTVCLPICSQDTNPQLLFGRPLQARALVIWNRISTVCLVCNFLQMVSRYLSTLDQVSSTDELNLIAQLTLSDVLCSLWPVQTKHCACFMKVYINDSFLLVVIEVSIVPHPKARSLLSRECGLSVLLSYRVPYTSMRFLNVNFVNFRL